MQLTPKKTGSFTVKVTVWGTIPGSGANQIDTKNFLLSVINPVAVTPVATPDKITVPIQAAVKPPQQVSNPTPVENITTKNSTPSVTLQNTQEQQSTPTPPSTQSQQVQVQPKPQTKPNSSGNIFSSAWNFIKNIFKMKISITTSN